MTVMARFPAFVLRASKRRSRLKSPEVIPTQQLATCIELHLSRFITPSAAIQGCLMPLSSYVQCILQETTSPSRLWINYKGIPPQCIDGSQQIAPQMSLHIQPFFGLSPSKKRA